MRRLFVASNKTVAKLEDDEELSVTERREPLLLMFGSIEESNRASSGECMINLRVV